MSRCLKTTKTPNQPSSKGRRGIYFGSSLQTGWVIPYYCQEPHVTLLSLRITCVSGKEKKKTKPRTHIHLSSRANNNGPQLKIGFEHSPVHLNNREPHLSHSNWVGNLHGPNGRGRLVWGCYICRIKRFKSMNPDVVWSDPASAAIEWGGRERGSAARSRAEERVFFEAVVQAVYSPPSRGLCAARNRPQGQWGLISEASGERK